jgi:ABC-type antimicrobial peptide transport system permease subunit
MSKAGYTSIAAFLVFALCGLALFFLLRPWLVGVAAFLVTGMIGSLVASRLFARYATAEEKRQDLEVRVRNPDL